MTLSLSFPPMLKRSRSRAGGVDDAIWVSSSQVIYLSYMYFIDNESISTVSSFGGALHPLSASCYVNCTVGIMGTSSRASSGRSWAFIRHLHSERLSQDLHVPYILV